MNQPMQDQRTLVSLRIEAVPFRGDRQLTFTAVDQSGNALSGTSFPDNGGIENLHDVFSRIAAQTAPAEGELPFGGMNQERIMLGFDGYAAPHYQFHVTIAYPNGDAGYLPITLSAPVTQAALDRLVEGVRQLKDQETEAIDWTVAD